MEGPYLRIKDLVDYINLSKSTIYDLTNPKSERFDDTFPARIQLGPRAVVWSKAEIDEWCSKPKQKVRLDRPPGAELPINRIRIRKPSTIKPKGIPQPELIEWECMIRLQQRDAYLLELLGQEAWTPAMAALLANGYKAPLGCTKIPKSLQKLDGEMDTPNGSFRTSVQSIVRNWEEYIEDVEENSKASSHVEPLLMTRSPIEFLIWFDEEEIDTPWLRLIRRLAGCPVQDDPQSFKLLALNVPIGQVTPCTATNDLAVEETSVSLAKPRTA